MIVFEPLHPAPRLPVGSGHALQPGETVEDFEITQVLGLTSFGVIYLAMDLAQRRAVVIKEYLPVAIAERAADGRIELRNPDNEAVFQRGLQSFISEALTLSQFDHPGLLRVSCVWEGNGTAYRAMPHYVGTSLLAKRFSSKQPPDEPALRSMMSTLLGALDVLHGAGFSHGQIEPMNVMVLDDGHSMLLDFDAARHAILSDPHLPFVDAYADDKHLALHQAADLEALASVMHFSISGQWAPMPQGTPRRHEPLASALSHLKDGATSAPYDPLFLAAIDRALAADPGERPQTIAEFRAMFEPAAAPTPAPTTTQPPASTRTEPPPPTESGALQQLPVVAASAAQSAAIERAEASTASFAAAAPPPSPALRQRRPVPRPLPDRVPSEYPLNSSESVLEMLAGFGRAQRQSEDVEAFKSPAVPTLTEVAEPALAPLRESPFDTLDEGHELPRSTLGFARVNGGAMGGAPLAPGRSWRRILVWAIPGLLVLVLAAGALAWRWHT